MIVYGTTTDGASDSLIRFPIYSEQTIRNKDMKNNGALTAGMLTVKEDAEDGIDIYDKLRLLAGPMGNFYADTEYSIKKQHLHYTGLRVPIDGMYIKMLDLWGTDFTVRPDQPLIKLIK
jgi:hypothetical protein